MLFQQLVLLGTGLVLTATLAPVLPLPALGDASPGTVLALTSLGVVAVIILLPVVAPALERLTTRLLRREVAWPVVERGALSAHVAALVLPWLAYGVAFWLFGLALLGPEAPRLPVAAAAFILAAFALSSLCCPRGASAGAFARKQQLVGARAPCRRPLVHHPW